MKVLTDQWPIVLHVSEGAPTDADFDAYVRDANAVLARGEPHVVVMDSSRVTRVSSYGKMMKKDWMEQHGEALRRCCLGCAVVLPSPVLRFISSTIMLLRPFPIPYYVCETIEEAMAWANARLLERRRHDDDANAH